MTEEGAIAALTDIGETFSTFTGLWVSVTFAYLSVAYLVGKSLTRFQCAAISILYILSSITFGFSAQAYADSWVKLHQRVTSVFDDVFAANFPYYGEAAAAFFVAGTVLSLYFMYDIRRSRSAPESP